ncbi:Fe(3+) ABC transporter substrate-binding protein, partial [Pantoea allii]
MKKLMLTSVTSLLFTAALAGPTLALAADKPAGTLVVYTSQAPEIAQQTMDAFKAAYP